jgi:hypothetical protein
MATTVPFTIVIVSCGSASEAYLLHALRVSFIRDESGTLRHSPLLFGLTETETQLLFCSDADENFTGCIESSRSIELS